MENNSKRMKKIGLLSDTHAWWDEKYATYFANCDEIWHAGDIGSEEVLWNLKKNKQVRAVYGNIDSHFLRIECPEIMRFRIEEIDVLLTHIGGTPGKYNPDLKEELESNPPKLLVCGHTHILKIIYDTKRDMLYMNPGAAGKFGHHQVRTLLRFTIDKDDLRDLEVIELK